MNTTSFFERFSARSRASALRVFAMSACISAVAVGCSDDGSDPATGSSYNGIGTTGGTAAGTTAGGGAVAPGLGGTAGAGATLGAGTLAGGGALSGTAGGIAAGGAGGVGTAGGTVAGGATAGAGGATAGGSTNTNTPWCKAKAVFDSKCVACHDGQMTAGTPMGLKSFADLTANSAQYPGSKIYTRALTRMKATTAMMPPQGGLTPADIQAVDAWVQAGAPAGDNPTCAGATGAGATTGGGVQAAEDWPTDCDGTYKILSHSETNAAMPYSMPPGTETHPGFTFDAPWGSDEVQAIGMRPVTDNKKILHHWILYANSGTRAFLTGWAPGQDASKGNLPSNVGMFMPSGKGSLYLDMHYNSLQTTAQEVDKSGVEICVVKKPKFRPNTATVYMGFVGIPFIPADAVNYDVTSTCTVTASSPVHLLTASPHAHKLATHMKFTAVVGGKNIVMHDQAFDFNEQTSHPLSPEVILNTGDTVTTTCTYTNTTGNLVSFSENTDGEMCFNFATYYPMGALDCGGLGGLFGGGGGGFLGGF